MSLESFVNREHRGTDLNSSAVKILERPIEGRSVAGMGRARRYERGFAGELVAELAG